VGYLLDEIRLHGDSKELKDEVTELARKYGIVTPYTAYLIQEDETRRNVPLGMQTLPRGGRILLDQKESEVRMRLLSENRVGDAAVANSRSFYKLKSAEVAQSGIVAGNTEALRRAPGEAPLSSSDRSAVVTSPALTYSYSTTAGPSTTVDVAKKLEQQGRFLGGKTFFQNGDKWIDSDVQKQKDAKRVQVKFGSDEYFILLAKEPRTKSWLAQGRNVEFVLGGTIYEIVD
jgi:Ca-activated chloride channel family protein